MEINLRVIDSSESFSINTFSSPVILIKTTIVVQAAYFLH